MPRKANVTKTEETGKTTRKRSSKNTTTKLEFNMADIINWSDEECKEKDKTLKFTVADVRDILKSLVSTNENLVTTTNNLNLVKSTLSKGLMTGYQIECPHCKREYVVNSMELKREGTILCKICGTEYKEDEHIKGISFVSEEDKVTII